MTSDPRPIPPATLPYANPRLKARRSSGINWAWLLGVLLLIGWAYWWGLSLTEGILVGGARTWVPYWDFLGVDLQHSYLAARHWLAGGNPYVEDFGDSIGQRFVYSP